MAAAIAEMALPFLRSALPSLLKTLGSGALAGGAGFGVSSLLKEITVSMYINILTITKKNKQHVFAKFR